MAIASAPARTPRLEVTSSGDRQSSPPRSPRWSPRQEGRSPTRSPPGKSPPNKRPNACNVAEEGGQVFGGPDRKRRAGAILSALAQWLIALPRKGAGDPGRTVYPSGPAERAATAGLALR